VKNIYISCLLLNTRDKCPGQEQCWMEEKDTWTITWINPPRLSKVAARSQVRYHQASAMAQAVDLVPPIK